MRFKNPALQQSVVATSKGGVSTHAFSVSSIRADENVSEC